MALGMLWNTKWIPLRPLLVWLEVFSLIKKFPLHLIIFTGISPAISFQNITFKFNYGQYPFRFETPYQFDPVSKWVNYAREYMYSLSNKGKLL